MAAEKTFPQRESALSRVDEKVRHYSNILKGWVTLRDLLDGISPEKEENINELLNHLRIWEVR